MSWYRKLASARSKKMVQLRKLIEELGASKEGSAIDKLSCEKKLDEVLQKIEKANNGLIISKDLLSYIVESLIQAKSVLRDSPLIFDEIIEDAMITLDEELYSLETKG